MAPASILLVSELFPPAVGGSGALLANIYSRLTDTAISVLTDPVASGGDRVLEDRWQRHWTRINGRWRGMRSLGEIEQIWRVSRAIRRIARTSDVVVHAGRPLPEGLPAMVARLHYPQGPRFVCWAHGEDLAVARTSREHRWLAGKVCNAASMMIGNSRFTASIIASFGVPDERIRVVHPGVDPQRYNPGTDGSLERARLAPRGPMLLTVGRLQRRKGHDLTIAAIARLIAEYPGLMYVIAGDGPERLRLESLTDEYGVRGHVTFLGNPDDSRLPGLYAACDIFVMPTRQDGVDVEGFGIVFLEAAASGKPSIGGRNGGVPESIAEGGTGLLVSGTDPDELAQSIGALLRDDVRRASMGAAARSRVCQTLTWEHSARAVETIQDELMSNLAR